jgi:hypothetical protein
MDLSNGHGSAGQNAETPNSEQFNPSKEIVPNSQLGETRGPTDAPWICRGSLKNRGSFENPQLLTGILLRK